ncbi:MAG: formate dehydrogenase accessory sulfurtransferase FdhD [Gemmatimonadota bacterium]
MSELPSVPPAGPPAAPETPVRLEVAGRHLTRWLCTPEHLEALAAGWLVCEGLARDGEAMGDIRFDPETSTVHAPLSPAPGGTVEPDFRLDRIPAEGPRAGEPLRRILTGDGTLPALFRAMFDRCTRREAGGGMHAGGLVRDGSLVDVVEDVGRQNVVDKLVGMSVLRGESTRGDLLLASGRISGAIAAKAWRAGLAAVASLSIPTTLARDLAQKVGITLVGRAARSAPHVYWPGSAP